MAFVPKAEEKSDDDCLNVYSGDENDRLRKEYLN